MKKYSTLLNNSNKVKSKNKISALFESPEFKTDEISFNSSGNEPSDKGGFLNDNENENNKDLSKIEDYTFTRNNIKRKTKMRKKMGYNAYDFVI